MTNKPARPTEERYWDPDDLLTEEQRQFDVCNGCRLCWNLCPAFPSLFNIADEAETHERKISREEFNEVEDLCFQCKLCWVVCPYTDPLSYNLDIPRVIERSKFIRAESEGIKFSKKLVSDQDRLAKLAGGIKAPLTNFANQFGPTRKIIGMIANVHPDAILPTYQTETFRDWFGSHQTNSGNKATPAKAIPSKKVALFTGCTVNYNDPQIGKACVSVLEHNNVDVVMPEQQCCGMPLTDVGDYVGASKKMDYNLERLVKLVDDGYDIVVPQPTCALVLREDYPERSAESEAASRVAEHTFEFGHYMVNLAREKLLVRDFDRGIGKVGFHLACHTRRQAVGNNSARLLGLLPDTEVVTVESCSGHDGTWGVSKQYFPLALKVGKKLFDNLDASSPDILVSDCPLAARHVEIGTGRRPIHTAQALATAYGLTQT